MKGPGDTFDVSWSCDGLFLSACFSSGSLMVQDATYYECATRDDSNLNPSTMVGNHLRSSYHLPIEVNNVQSMKNEEALKSKLERSNDELNTDITGVNIAFGNDLDSSSSDINCDNNETIRDKDLQLDVVNFGIKSTEGTNVNVDTEANVNVTAESVRIDTLTSVTSAADHPCQ